MTKKITNTFKTHMVEALKADVDSTADHVHYVFAGKATEWDEESSPDVVDLSVQGSWYNPYKEMIFGTRLTANDVSLMVAKNAWLSGTVYSEYDHEDDELHTKKFFVVTQEGTDYSVFKCLKNNNFANSTHMPILSETAADDVEYQTSDGYIWKYMFTIPEATYDKFDTTNWIPVVENAAVVSNAANGAIHHIEVSAGGGNYNSYANGNIVQTGVDGDAKKFYVESGGANNSLIFSLSANTNFYKDSAIYITGGSGAGQIKTITEYGTETDSKYLIVNEAFSPSLDATSTFDILPQVYIVGDGSGALAKSVVNTAANTIVGVDMLALGANYSYANITILANTGYIDDTNPTAATIKAIISPKGGHGANSAAELFSTAIGYSVDFANTLPASNNTFRTVGILHNPVFNEVTMIVNDSTGFTTNTIITDNISGAYGTITAIDGGTDTLTIQDVTGIFTASGVIVSTNAASSNSVSVTPDFTTFDQRVTINRDTLLTIEEFTVGEMITQSSSGATGYVYSTNTTVMTVTSVTGIFANTAGLIVTGSSTGASMTITGIVEPDIKSNTGEIHYLENMQPITKSETSTERVKIVISY